MAVAVAESVIVEELKRLLPPEQVLWRDYDLMLYEYDGSIDKHRPSAVVFALSTEQVSQVVKACNNHQVPYTARGAGTGLSGGAIPINGGVLISLARMTRILDIDPENMCAIVEPGVVNLRLGQATAQFGLTYVPDPSSQKACTIGGNVGENSGGPHTLRYGVTTNHTLGLEVVLPDGEIVTLGGSAPDTPGYDLVGLLVGSEGTLGIVTKVWVRLVPIGETVKTILAVFGSMEDASSAVAGMIARRIIPAAIEMMDNLTIRAIESRSKAGYPVDAEGVVLIEVDGLREQVEAEAEAVDEVCRENGALKVRLAKDEAERAALWAGRKGAFAAIGRLTPDYYTVDGVVPRTKLPATLARIQEISRESGFRIANVFHAGDGSKTRPIRAACATRAKCFQRRAAASSCSLGAGAPRAGSRSWPNWHPRFRSTAWHPPSTCTPPRPTSLQKRCTQLTRLARRLRPWAAARTWRWGCRPSASISRSTPAHSSGSWSMSLLISR